MLDSLDADAIRRWCATGLAALRRHQREIDDLNVFPVPDGDTGTNLVLTFTAAQQQLDGLQTTDLRDTMLAFARGALLGARGNSGVIISQLLRGLAGAFEVATACRPRRWPPGLTDAADAAYRAVADPVEGTMLSVARGAARAARAVDTDELARVARAAALGAAEALARTPDQLPALARAGVVDAGGRGLVVLLDALVEVITGQPCRSRCRGSTTTGVRSCARPGPPSSRSRCSSCSTRRRTPWSVEGHARRRSAIRWSSSVPATRRSRRDRPAGPDVERARARQRRRRRDRGRGRGRSAAPHLGDPFRRPDQPPTGAV